MLRTITAQKHRNFIKNLIKQWKAVSALISHMVCKKFIKEMLRTITCKKTSKKLQKKLITQWKAVPPVSA
jgi:hypothetical protein